MLPIYLIARQAFSTVLRSPFFVIWNLLSFLLILSLIFITFFNFESGSAVSEIFLTTLLLSGCVNALVFHAGMNQELAARQWDLLLTRPPRPEAIAVGKFAGLTAFQWGVGLLDLLGHLIESRFLGNAIPEAIWTAWLIVMLQVTMVGALYGLLAIWLSEFWAVAAMVGAFLLGHLAIDLQQSLPAGLSWIISTIFCAIPDLEPPAPGGEASIAGLGFGGGLRAGAYSLSYTLAMVYISALSVRPAAERR
jgi:hypothetical protein